MKLITALNDSVVQNVNLIYSCCSVAQSCLTLCDSTDCDMPCFPVLHCLLEFAQTHARWVSEAIQLSHSLLSTSPAFYLPQHQGLFQWVRSFPKSWFFASGGQSIGASTSASILPGNIQGWFPLWLTGLISLQSKGLSGVFTSTTVWKHQFLGT